MPFICECRDAGCRELARLTLEEYRAVRENPGHFLNLPRHESAPDWIGSVVERNDRFIVVERAVLNGRSEAAGSASDT